MDNAIIKIEESVKNENGRIIVNSIDVAIIFEKRHDHVLRDIDRLMETFDKDLPIFGEISVPDSYGRGRRAFNMDRDGFSLLAMGFTGEKAVRFKLAFIRRFNEMEEALTIQPVIPNFNDPVAAAEAWIEKAKSERALIAQLEDQKPKVLAYEKFINSDGLFTLTAAGKIIYNNPNKFTEKLRDEGILYKKSPSGPNLPYQYYLDSGYFIVKTSDSNGRTSPQTLVTITGIDWLSRKVCNHKQIDMFGDAEPQKSTKKRSKGTKLRLVI